MGACSCSEPILVVRRGDRGERLHGVHSDDLLGEHVHPRRVSLEDRAVRRRHRDRRASDRGQEGGEGNVEVVPVARPAHRARVQRISRGVIPKNVVHPGLCRELGIRHIRTRAYRPRTNGKAERFIQTLTRRWAYGQPYPSSERRRAALSTWIQDYNHRRPHGSLGNQTPAARLAAPNQPAPTERKRRKHVPCSVAADIRCGSRPVAQDGFSSVAQTR